MQYLFKGPGSPERSKEQDHDAIVNLISDDLAFLLPLLRKFPKCYWIWNYRLWLLKESTRLLPTAEARKFWQQELVLAGKMLSLDSRNFHGWGYRRTVVQALESTELSAQEPISSMAEQEFEYTTQMINSNLSNFSAWHTRSKLIPRLLDERGADNEARRRFLDEGNHAERHRYYLHADCLRKSLSSYNELCGRAVKISRCGSIINI